jgi:hypothetical protein
MKLKWYAFETWLRTSRREDVALLAKYRQFSMIPKLKFLDNTRLVRAVTVPGAIVECGTWRGGMSAAMAEALPGRTSFLFDSFEGLPDPGEQDGQSAVSFVADDRLEAPEAQAREAMAMTGQRFELVKGWFDETVPKFAADTPQIAVLRLDGDWYDSTMVCLEHLFPLVVDGGLVLIDDYGHWDGCTLAVHDYLSRERRAEPIQQSRWRQTFMVKGLSGTLA